MRHRVLCVDAYVWFINYVISIHISCTYCNSSGMNARPNHVSIAWWSASKPYMSLVEVFSTLFFVYWSPVNQPDVHDAHDALSSKEMMNPQKTQRSTTSVVRTLTYVRWTMNRSSDKYDWSRWFKRYKEQFYGKT